MNAYSASNRKPAATASASARPYVSAHTPSRPPHRARDFGVGYGTSSGYASSRSYVSRTATPLFRCV